MSAPLRVVVISDTHNQHDRFTLPEGDVLVHCGDFTAAGSDPELRDFDRWLAGLPFEHKLIVAGNHEYWMDGTGARIEALIRHGRVLMDELVEIAGRRFYGMSWVSRGGGPSADRFDRIPAELDMLLTHEPPFGVLDRTLQDQHLGCPELLGAVQLLRPRRHAFGHIHENAGETEQDGTRFINACVVDELYRPAREAWLIDV